MAYFLCTLCWWWTHYVPPLTSQPLTVSGTDISWSYEPDWDVEVTAESGTFTTVGRAEQEARFAASSILRDRCASKNEELIADSVSYDDPSCTYTYVGDWVEHDAWTVFCEVDAHANCALPDTE